MERYNSFEELGKAFGIKKKARKESTMVCRKCGGIMRHVEGTNVYLCENPLKDKNGKVIKEDGKVKTCGNRVLAKKPG